MPNHSRGFVFIRIAPLTSLQGLEKYYESIRTSYYSGDGKSSVWSDTGSVSEIAPPQVTGDESPYLHVHVVVANSIFGQDGELRKPSHLG